jgi:hypothetical protein
MSCDEADGSSMARKTSLLGLVAVSRPTPIQAIPLVSGR